MVQTYRIEGFSRSLLLLVCCFAVASLVAILIWMESLGSNAIFLLVVGVLLQNIHWDFSFSNRRRCRETADLVVSILGKTMLEGIGCGEVGVSKRLGH